MIVIGIAWRQRDTPQNKIDAVSTEAGQDTNVAIATADSSDTTAAPSTSSTPTVPEAAPGPIQNSVGPLDITLWCTSRFGDDAAAEVTGNGSDDWACRGGSVANDQAIDFEAACAFAYGDGARAQNLTNDPYDWECKPDSDAALRDGPCAIGVGRFDPSNTHDFARYAAAFLTTWNSQAEAPCPATVMHRWSEGVIQELGPRFAGEYGGAILATDPDNVVLLTGAIWSSYAQVIGLSPGLVGFPTGPVDESAGDSSILPLSAGGALVARTSTEQYHWIPGVALTTWLQSGGVGGCLGAPVSNPYAIPIGFRQDYENGALILDVTIGEMQTEGECTVSFD